MLKFTYIIILLFSVYFIASGQDLQSDLLFEINTVQNTEYILINSAKLLKYNNKELLASLKVYSDDTSTFVRLNVQMLEYKIALKNANDTAIRHEVVYRLINDLKFPDDRVSRGAVNKLMNFNISDFNSKAKALFTNNFKKFIQCKELYLLIGKLNIQEVKNYMLSKINFNPSIKLSDLNSTNWGMQLALARMGNIESIDYVVKSIDNYSDPIAKYTLLLKDLSYTRQKESVLLLRKYLDNTNRLPSVVFGDEGAPCNIYAIEELAVMLQSFPTKSSDLGYTQEEIETARKWIDNQTTFTFKE